MKKRITRTQHTRRQFLRAAAAVGIGAGTAAFGGARAIGAELAEVDVFEARLDTYANKVTRYTTAWGQVVDDWYPAFVAAHADLAAHGGGRLIVPGGDASAERTYH